MNLISKRVFNVLVGPDPDDLPDVSTLLSDPDTGVWFNDNMAGFAISTETANCQHFYQLHSFSVDIVKFQRANLEIKDANGVIFTDTVCTTEAFAFKFSIYIDAFAFKLCSVFVFFCY